MDQAVEGFGHAVGDTGSGGSRVTPCQDLRIVLAALMTGGSWPRTKHNCSSPGRKRVRTSTTSKSETFSQAALVFDRFHATKLLTDAVDEVSLAEQRLQPVLKNSRYLWLHNAEFYAPTRSQTWLIDDSATIAETSERLWLKALDPLLVVFRDPIERVLVLFPALDALLQALYCANQIGRHVPPKSVEAGGHPLFYAFKVGLGGHPLFYAFKVGLGGHPLFYAFKVGLGGHPLLDGRKLRLQAIEIGLQFMVHGATPPALPTPVRQGRCPSLPTAREKASAKRKVDEDPTSAHQRRQRPFAHLVYRVVETLRRD